MGAAALSHMPVITLQLWGTRKLIYPAGKDGHLDAILPGLSENAADLDSPAAKLWVTKDLILTGGGGGADSFMSIGTIEQTFSQIPEPGTVLLVGLGLLGAVALKRRL